MYKAITKFETELFYRFPFHSEPFSVVRAETSAGLELFQHLSVDPQLLEATHKTHPKA